MECRTKAKAPKEKGEGKKAEVRWHTEKQRAEKRQRRGRARSQVQGFPGWSFTPLSNRWTATSLFSVTCSLESHLSSLLPQLQSLIPPRRTNFSWPVSPEDPRAPAQIPTLCWEIGSLNLRGCGQNSVRFRWFVTSLSKTLHCYFHCQKSLIRETEFSLRSRMSFPAPSPPIPLSMESPPPSSTRSTSSKLLWKMRILARIFQFGRFFFLTHYRQNESRF